MAKKRKKSKLVKSLVKYKFQEGYDSVDLHGDLQSFDPIFNQVGCGNWHCVGNVIEIRSFPIDNMRIPIATFYGHDTEVVEASAKLASYAKRLLMALRHCERAMNAQVQMCHDRDSHFTDPKVHSRPADYQAMVAEMYAQTAEPLAHARKLLKEINEEV